MRSVMNISLPKELARDIENAVKKGNYASRSEFIRDLVRSWKEADLAEEWGRMEKESGKWKKLRSLKDLA